MTSATNFEQRLFINNEYIQASSGEILTARNSYDQSVLTENVQVAGQEDVDRAVRHAQEAFKTWRTTPARDRADMMLRFADIVNSHIDQIAKLESLCMGCPMVLARNVVGYLAGCFRYYAGLVDKIHGETYAEDADGLFKMVLWEPLGVCAAISGWNATPIFLGCKIAPAIAAGNTIVFKSSEKSPLRTLYLGALFKEAGFPPGVINLLSGGPSTGSMLASHMKIAKISYTGSTEAGRQVQIAAAQSNLKQVALELGGKSASIVFADAMFENAVLHNSRMFLLNSTQVCSAASRVLVHESIADKFVKALRESFEAVTTGDPSDETTFMGPLVDAIQTSRVQAYIKQAESEGIEVITGGFQETADFVRPTIFLNPPQDSAIYREEIFGPVLTVKTFKTETEAIDLANGSHFGLSTIVFTSNMQRALRVVPKLESGMASVNTFHAPSHHTPWGGWKQSGYGRESGVEGLREYLQSKSVHINMRVVGDQN